MADRVKKADDMTFDEVVCQSQPRVLVDFWATWCSPCVAIGKHLESRAVDYASRLTILKVNADDSTRVASKFLVRGLPTLILLKDGQLVARHLGGMTPTKLNDLLEKWSAWP